MKNRTHKLLLIFIKYSTWFLAGFYFIGMILLYFGIYPQIISWFCFTSIVPILLLYLNSLAFQFCIWHRLPLYYIFICNIINLLNWLGYISIFNLSWYFIIFGFLILLGAYLKNRYNEKIRITKIESS